MTVAGGPVGAGGLISSGCTTDTTPRLAFDSCHGGTHLAHKFEIYKDKAGEFRVRFKYNSEVMFMTEGYASKASAQNAIDSIKKNGPEAPVEDNS
jgi:uncharacterized protein YegP (UPF0339 family)